MQSTAKTKLVVHTRSHSLHTRPGNIDQMDVLKSARHKYETRMQQERAIAIEQSQKATDVE